MAQRLVWSGTWSGIDALAGRWGLPPDLALRAEALGEYARRYGLADLYITSGHRGRSDQLRLREMARGGAPGIFSPARCSSHVYGNAFDASPALGSKSISDQAWRTIGAIAQALGLRWGGLGDPVHFDTGEHLDALRRGDDSWCI